MNKQELENNQRYIADDEIDLVDLFMIVWKRKTMIVVVTLLLTIAAAGISYFMPKVYEVTAILEPAVGESGKLIENPQTIRENIIGGAYDQGISNKFNLLQGGIPKFKVSVPKKTALVKISVESSEPQRAVLILQELTVIVSASVQERLNLIVNKLENDIKKTQLQDGFLLQKINAQKGQIIQTGLKMSALEKEYKRALAAPRGDAMAVLLYSNEIQNQQIYWNDLQIELVNVTAQRSQLMLKIDGIRLVLASLKGVSVIKEPTVSTNPIKPKKTLIVALAGMLGLMGGIMLAFLAEFMNKVKQQQAKENH